MRVRHLLLLTVLPALLLPSQAAAQDADAATIVTQFLNAQRTDFEEVALRIWDWAEVGYQEEQSFGTSFRNSSPPAVSPWTPGSPECRPASSPNGGPRAR